MNASRSRAAAALLAAALLTVAACAKKQASTPPAKPEDTALAVGTESVYRVAAVRLSSGPVISGSLEAEKTATVAAQVPGAVLASHAEEGQTVAEGALLARIDDSAMREAVLSAQSALRAMEQQVTVARRNAERSEAVLQGGAIPEREVETARWNVTNAQAGVADARSRLSYAREQLAKTMVHAPIRGIVSKKSVSPGDTVQPGSPLYTVVDPARMRLVAHVPAEGIANLQVGTPVEFTVAGMAGQRFTGHVERINPVADPATRQVEIFVSLPNDTGSLVGGLYAEGRVAAAARDALAVPTAAVERSLGQPAVLRVSGGRVERVPVQLGITDESAEKVEVVSGVAAGDVVLLGAARGITPGAKVVVEGVHSSSAATSNPAAHATAAAAAGRI
jgi:RND family efflux transporter MFP subunit